MSKTPPKIRFLIMKNRLHAKIGFRSNLVEDIVTAILSHRSSLQVLWFGLPTRMREIPPKSIFAPWKIDSSESKILPFYLT